EVVQGSMLDQEVDAWVSPTNARASMDGGLDGVIKGHFGPAIERRVQLEIKRRYGGLLLPVGHATCVPTGAARPSFLISTPTMTASSEDISDTMNVALACAAAFQAVHMQNALAPGSIGSIALPGLGANTGRVPVEICADLMWTGYNLFRRRAFDDFAAMRAALEAELGDLGPGAVAKPKAKAGRHGRGPAGAPSPAPPKAVTPVEQGRGRRFRRFRADRGGRRRHDPGPGAALQREGPDRVAVVSAEPAVGRADTFLIRLARAGSRQALPRKRFGPYPAPEVPGRIAEVVDALRSEGSAPGLAAMLEGLDSPDSAVRARPPSGSAGVGPEAVGPLLDALPRAVDDTCAILDASGPSATRAIPALRDYATRSSSPAADRPSRPCGTSTMRRASPGRSHGAGGAPRARARRLRFDRPDGSRHRGGRVAGPVRPGSRREVSGPGPRHALRDRDPRRGRRRADRAGGGRI
ncbi:MAG: macro domain-containing protein, partial [Singulisphaera sp.]